MTEPRHVTEAKKYFEDLIEKYFGEFKEPVDWAERMARRVVSISLDNRGFLAGTKWTEEEQLAFILATQLAIELRHLKSQAREAETAYVDAETKKVRRKLRDQFASASFMAEFVRDAAGILDEKGASPEANVLRDAASILDTEF